MDERMDNRCFGRFFYALIVLHTIAFSSINSAAELSLSQSKITIDEHLKKSKVKVSIDTADPEDFYVSISSTTSNDALSDDGFRMSSMTPGAGGEVILTLGFPYEKLETNVLQRKGSSNRVKNHQSIKATSRFSQCKETGRVCKPLAIYIKEDDTAIPGVVYATTLNIQVSDTGGQSEIRRLTIHYKKDGAAVGIRKRNYMLLLNQGNSFSASTSLCVFSPVFNKFDISLESNLAGNNSFLLLGKKYNQYLPYQVKISLSGSNAGRQEAVPGRWVTGGDIVKVRTAAECRLKNNVWIYLNIDKNDVLESRADTYSGILVARVKAL